jgi:hypothetical protein
LLDFDVSGRKQFLSRSRYDELQEGVVFLFCIVGFFVDEQFDCPMTTATADIA